MESVMRKQQGQSIVEFLVAASFVLVPMLFLTTYLGKVGDIQHRAVEGSRYAVWESAKASKSTAQIQNEINKRILYKDHRQMDSATDGQSSDLDVSRIDPLYFHIADDGTYETLVAQTGDTFNETTTQNEAPEASGYQGRIDAARLGPARIDVSDRGLLTASVEYVTSTTKWLQSGAYSQKAHNVLLAETWRATTDDRVEDAIDDAILARSDFISGPQLEVGTQLATLLGLEEWEELEPGHIEHDVVPCSRLVPLGGGEGAEDACH